jgi:hypothetical protein
MNNPNLPAGTDLRDVEGHPPVHRSDNAGIGAGSIDLDDRTEDERVQDLYQAELERIEHKAKLDAVLEDMMRRYL